MAKDNSWKTSYVFMERDRKRIHITCDELCDERRAWVWRFSKGTGHAFEDHTIVSRFHPSGKYTSTFNPGQSGMLWSFVNGITNYSGSCIQVHSYPTISTYRTENWDWGISNEHGNFSPSDLEDIPSEALFAND